MVTLQEKAELVRLWVVMRLAGLREQDRDRGSNTTETVLWIVGIAVLALAIIAIVVVKVTDKANTIDLQ